MQEAIAKVKAFTASLTARLFLIGFLIFVLLIPLAMIGVLVYERESRYRSALTEVSSKWGSEQVLVGPILSVPYFGPGSRGYSEWQTLRILPESLEITAAIDPEVRSRGIFDILLYTSAIKIKGSFPAATLLDPSLDQKGLRLNEAVFSMGISDIKGLHEGLELKWGSKTPAIKAASSSDGPYAGGVKTGQLILEKDQKINFELSFNLQGSKTLQFVPTAPKTGVSMSSSWQHPSFSGVFLPLEHQIDDKGFNATWDIPPFGKNFNPYWLESANANDYSGDYRHRLTESAFGVDLFFPTDFYQKTTRSVKYGILFVIFTFLSFFLFEVINRLRVHPFQYLLVGFSLSVFYLLLLSLSEHINFTASYLLSSLAVIGLITSYCVKVLRSQKRGFVMGVILVALYAYLYFLLNNTDYALLIGSISLFLVLGFVMYLTRNIDWYKMDEAS